MSKRVRREEEAKKDDERRWVAVYAHGAHDCAWAQHVFVDIGDRDCLRHMMGYIPKTHFPPYGQPWAFLLEREEKVRAKGGFVVYHVNWQFGALVGLAVACKAHQSAGAIPGPLEDKPWFRFRQDDATPVHLTVVIDCGNFNMDRREHRAVTEDEIDTLLAPKPASPGFPADCD